MGTTFIEAFLTSLPYGIGNFLDKIIYDNNRSIESKIDEIKDLLITFTDNSYSIQLKEAPAGFFNDFINEYQIKYPSQKDKINLELLEKISIYKDCEISGIDTRKGYQRLKCDVLNNMTDFKKIYQSIVLPPFISHFHLLILSNLMYCCALGFKVKLLILDEPYELYKSKREKRDWPSKTLALLKLYDFIEMLPEKLKLSPIICRNLETILESDLVEDGEVRKTLYKKFRDGLALESGLSNQLQKTSFFYSKQFQEIAFQDNLIREYFFGTITFQASYIFSGSDRIPLWSFFNETILKSIDQPSLYTHLVITEIPTYSGSPDIRLDSNVYFIDQIQKNDYGRIDASFITWFKENINHTSIDKLHRSDVEMIKEYFRDLNNSIPYTNAIDNIIKLQNNPNFIACYCFGNYAFLSTLSSKEDLNISNYIGDIDLLFIVKADQKTVSVAKEIYTALNRFGKVTFHPDFYSKRTSDLINFDIIVLPEGSSYFKKLGLLTWLSAFESNSINEIFGNRLPLSKLLRCPDIQSLNNYRYRISCYKDCHYGINHMQSQIFSNVIRANPQIDFVRVFKYIMMDYYWVKHGNFEKNIRNLIHVFKIDGFNSVQNIDEKLNYSDKELAEICYQLILEIKERIKN